MKLSTEIIKKYCCPECHGSLFLNIDFLQCNNCGKKYPIINDTPSFSYQSLDFDITAKAFSEQWDSYNKGDFEDEKVFGLSEKDYIDHFCYAFNIDNLESFSGTVLEVGVGSGHLIRALAERAPNALIIGLDISDNIFKLSKAFEKYSNVYLIHGDLLKPPLREDSIEYIYTSGVLHHTKDIFSSIKSLWKLLRGNGGQFYFWIYPSYQFCAYDTLRNILIKPYKWSKQTRMFLAIVLAPFMWLFFFITKKYSYKNSIESLATTRLRIFDNISPEFQYRSDKKDIENWCQTLKINNFIIKNDLGVLCIKDTNA